MAKKIARIRKSYRSGRENFWVIEKLNSLGYINDDGVVGAYVEFPSKKAAQAVLDLYLSKLPKSKAVRQFETGATRDTIEGKLSYVKGLSPIVLRRYLQYLNKHRRQLDGSLREFNNWKKGIPKGDYLDSEIRHSIDLWLIMQGFDAQDNHGPCNVEDLCCAIIFNVSGLLHETLKEKLSKIDKNEPAPEYCSSM